MSQRKTLWWLVALLLPFLLQLNIAGGMISCGDFRVEPGSVHGYVYKWFQTNLDNRTIDWKSSNSSCRALCQSCRLAISRNGHSSAVFLFKLVSVGRKLTNSSLKRSNWIGLHRDIPIASTWYWEDGLPCYPNNSSDVRCANTTLFDYKSSTAAPSDEYWGSIELPGNSMSLFYDDADGNGDGAHICEMNVTECFVASCPRGTFPDTNLDSNVTSCVLCPMYTYETGNACQECPMGRFSNSTGLTSCYFCSPGQFLDSNTNTCALCPIGTFQNNSGQTACQKCRPNFSTASTGENSSDACDLACIGGNSAEAANCNLCPKGTYTGFSSCIPCPQGSFGDQEGITSPMCIPCEQGTFNPNSGANDKTMCLTCLTSGCQSGSSFMPVSPGYWTNGSLLTSCVPFEACIGGNFTTDPQILCAQGYSSDFCSSCSPNYFRLSGLCRKCMASSALWVLLISSFVIVTFVARFLIRSKFRIETKVKLCFYWFQVLAMYPLLFQGWPQQLAALFNLFSLLNLDIGYFGIGCSMGVSFYTLTFLKLSLPFLLCGTLLIWEWSVSKKYSEIAHKVYSFVLYMINFFSIQIFSNLFQLFSCIPRNDGSFRLKYDPVEACYSSSWNQAVMINAGFMFLYLVLIPGMVLRSYFQAKHDNDLETFKSLFITITVPYREGCQAFELFKLGFKLGFVLIRDILQVSQIAKTAFLALLFYCHNWIDSWYRPYDTSESNALSML
eukprot:TRINITY_DN8463_c0_g2_i5.p1 TRINITY_DN8463_c0_g2~~TRINITY_DN8463_c0_g2_i5.p1  ORF type:complete len:735 (+),score=106.83 TRINITY_DN8463_c0_g2_i5:25-2205(+)